MISIHPMYSAPQVAVAAVLGGPLAGAWLLALNYRRLAAHRSARAAFVLGLLSAAAVGAIALGTSCGAMRWLIMLPAVVTTALAELLQGAAYVRHVAVGGQRGSSWWATAVGAVCLPVHLMPIVGAAVIHASPAYLGG